MTQFDFDTFYMWELIPALKAAGQGPIDGTCNAFLSPQFLSGLSDDAAIINQIDGPFERVMTMFSPAQLHCIAEHVGRTVTHVMMSDDCSRLEFTLDKNGVRDVELDRLIEASDVQCYEKQPDAERHQVRVAGALPYHVVWSATAGELDWSHGLELGSRRSSQHHAGLKTADTKDADVIIDPKLCQIALADASIDGIICEHTIEHLPDADIQKLAAECHRILQSGRHLIIECPDTVELIKAFRLLHRVLPDRSTQLKTLFHVRASHVESKTYKRARHAGLDEGAFELADHLSKVYNGAEGPGDGHMGHINMHYPAKVERLFGAHGFKRVASSHGDRGRHRFDIDKQSCKVDLRMEFERL